MCDNRPHELAIARILVEPSLRGGSSRLGALLLSEPPRGDGSTGGVDVMSTIMCM